MLKAGGWQVEDRSDRPGSRLLLRRSAGQGNTILRTGATALVRDLARAKAELARELEANLQQLREVLQQTERIAQDMEEVLREVRAPLLPEEGAGKGQGGGR